MSSQPSFWCVANIGDASPLEHDGAFVCVDRTGVYEPELVLLEALLLSDEDQEKFDNGDDSVKTHSLSTIVLERMTIIKDAEGNWIGVSDNRFHVDCFAWFGDSTRLSDVASYTDQLKDQLIKSLISSDPLEVASAYLDLIAYHGSDNFDPDPRRLTYAKAKEFANKMQQQIDATKEWHQGYF